MAVKINFNEASAQTHTALIRNERLMNKSLLRLSTGMRILNAADDSAGLFIADMLSTVAKAYEQGNRNIQTGFSALQIAESSAGNIYDKLQEIYVRAQNAANDINDPNARQALQREIMNFVDAIQKIGTDTEYNGIKLLDGSFTNKAIHYGARMDQTVTLNVSSLKAQDLGAYIAQGTGQTKGSGTATLSGTNFASWAGSSSTDAQAIYINSGDYFKVNGIDVAGTTNNLVDASVVAYNINNQETLKSLGIEATAKNVSTAQTAFSKVATVNYTSSDTAASATARLILSFFIGKETSADFSITSNAASFTGSATTSSDIFTNLDDLITQINTQASNAKANVVAEKSADGKLILRTTNGETIAISAQLNVTISGTATVTGTVNLDQLLQGAQSAATGNITASATHYAHAVKVGDLTIGGIDNFTVNQLGMDALGTGITTVNRQNLYSIDVTSNTGAETAIMIATKALQRVDTERAKIGATMNNLQSIFDAQKVAYDNTKEAESVIRNTDYAKEMSEFTTYQIRMQSTIAMLAQANTLPQLVLQLMR